MWSSDVWQMNVSGQSVDDSIPIPCTADADLACGSGGASCNGVLLIRAPCLREAGGSLRSKARIHAGGQTGGSAVGRVHRPAPFILQIVVNLNPNYEFDRPYH